MQDPHQVSNPEAQASAIESKQALLDYLRSSLCLTGLLSKAGWRYENGQWLKAGACLGVLVAAELELDRQIHDDKDRLLKATVAAYKSSRANT